MSIQSLVDFTRAYLENAIITGEFPPGMRIKEEEIASHLQISRPPIRQAFECLVIEGFLTRQPRRGVVVTKIEEKDIREIYTLKASLYILAIRLAIENMTAEGLDKLERTVQAMETCIACDPVDLPKYQVLNEDFHINNLLEIAEHGRLYKLLHNLKNQTKRLSYRNLQDQAHLELNCRQHRDIFEAIRAKDNPEAENLCRRHIFRGMDLLIKNLDKI